MGIETEVLPNGKKIFRGSCTLAIWVLKLEEEYFRYFFRSSCTLAIWVLKLRTWFSLSICCVLVRSLYGYWNFEFGDINKPIIQVLVRSLYGYWNPQYTKISHWCLLFLYARYMGIETVLPSESLYTATVLVRSLYGYWNNHWTGNRWVRIVLVRSLYGYWNEYAFTFAVEITVLVRSLYGYWNRYFRLLFIL